MRITTIAPGRWLDAPAAASYTRMRMEGLGPGINSAGRTAAEQEVLFLANYTRRAWNPLRPTWSRGPYRDVRWWRGHRYVRITAVQAAPPGASYSYHEKGNALDLPPEERAWMRHHGAPHGWFATVPGEPWHWEHVASHDRYRHIAVPPLPPFPPAKRSAPIPSEEDDMLLIRNDKTGGVYLLLLAPRIASPVRDTAEYAALQAFVPVKGLADPAFRALLARFDIVQ